MMYLDKQTHQKEVPKLFISDYDNPMIWIQITSWIFIEITLLECPFFTI